MEHTDIPETEESEKEKEKFLYVKDAEKELYNEERTHKIMGFSKKTVNVGSEIFFVGASMLYFGMLGNVASPMWAIGPNAVVGAISAGVATHMVARGVRAKVKRHKILKRLKPEALEDRKNVDALMQHYDSIIRHGRMALYMMALSMVGIPIPISLGMVTAINALSAKLFHRRVAVNRSSSSEAECEEENEEEATKTR